MKIGPKFKIAKRLGASIFEKTQSRKFALAQERSAKTKKRGRGPTEYGKQLPEIQKVRMTYGISERQFRNAVEESMESAVPVETLNRLLELRLDNVIYRLGLAKTRRFARQMVSHGHIMVNGVKTTIPSRRMRPGDRLSIRPGSRETGPFVGFAEKFMERPSLPTWISWNPKTMEGGVNEVPTRAAADPAGDLVAVMSFYSR